MQVAMIEQMIAHLQVDKERAMHELAAAGIQPVKLQNSDEVFYERKALTVLNEAFAARRGMRGPQ